MNYWLMKSEPGCYSFDDQERDGITHWDGVRNYQARNNMKNMKVGDLCFFYHSIKEKQIVGIVKVVKEHYPDPEDERFVWVDVEYFSRLNNPVTLSLVKERWPELALVKQSRLSVMPVEKEYFEEISNYGDPS
jgi:predicted RNA-binding protein with PUA-like domain